MKKTAISFVFMTVACHLWAQSESKVLVMQSPLIADLIANYKTYNEKNKTTSGYRLQIMFNNNREEIYNAKAQLYKNFPQENCYVEYEQPYYKLRLGDYPNRFEAYNMLNRILPLYPGAFLVKTGIQTK